MMHGLTAGRGTSLFTQAHHRLPRAQWGPHHMHATSTRCQHQWAPLLPHTSRCTRTACKSRPRLNIMCQAKVAKLAGTQTPQPLVPYERILRALNNPSKQAPLPSPPTEATFRHVIPYLIRLALDEKNLLWRAAAAFCCLLASKAAGLLCPLMFKKAVDSFTLHAADPLPVVLKCASQCLLLYGLCDILKHVFKELQAPLFTPLSQAASRRVAYHTFSHVLGLDIRFHLDRRTGRLSRILERGTRSIQMLYRAVLFTFAPTALELLFVCGVLAKVFNPLVGLMVIATFTAYCSWSIIMTQVATDARKHVNELDNATSAKAVDALLSYETVTLFNNQALEVGQYNVYLKQYMQAMVTTDRLAAVLNAGQSLILAVGLTGIMVTALYASGPNVSAGDMVMIQGLLLQLWAPLQFLGWFYRELRSALVDMDDFFGILRSESNIKDGTKPLPPVPAPYANMNGSSGHLAAANGVARNGNGGWNSLAGGLRQRTATHAGSNGSSYSDAWPSKAAVNGTHGGSRHSSSHDSSSNGIQQHSQQQGGPQSLLEQQALQAGAAEASQAAAAAQPAGLLVELEDVHFSYTPDRQILRGVSLRVEPGSSMALVGGSGSGKSTVLRLLTRLYDVNAGSVQLNGSDVRDITLETLRGAVAVVPQETTLFNDTIMQNIRYGRPTATDEEVIRAARMAHLDKAVERMPLGYNTMVGERGLKLSGGEKQRVAIARAFLRQPRLLICDEATSALDSETEKQIMASLDELARGRTSVFVAHRLSTVMNCDTIVVLSDGRVVEQGSHDVLMAKPGGVYRRMWELQAREDVEKAGRSKSRERNGGDEDSNGGAHKPSSLGDVPDGESDTSGSGSDSEREEGPEGREVVMQVAS